MRDVISDVNYSSWAMFVREVIGHIMQMVSVIPLASFRFNIL